MDIQQMKYFLAVAREENISRAAEYLYITQPSLSHAISQLENELGVPLFEKSGRNTTLTRFGEEFLVCAEHTLSTLDAGVSSIRKSARGEGLIRLGFLRTLGVEFIPRLAAGFLKKNAELDIHFTFHTGVTQHLLEGLAARKYDLIFCSEPLEKENLTVIPIQKQDLVLITPKDHPLASRNDIDLEETLLYPHIFFDKSSGIRNVVDRMFSQIGRQPEIAYETEEDQVIAGLVAQKFGIALVPYMDLLLKLDVKILSIRSPSCERAIFMINDNRIYMPPAVKRFREYVADGK